MIRDQFANRIEKAITTKSIKELTDYIIKFVDRNAEILMKLNLTDRYSFNQEDKSVVYCFLTVSEEEIIQAIRMSKVVNPSNRNHNNPFYHACILAAHFLLKKSKEKESKLVMTYMSMLMYVSIHSGSFPYKPNKEIMDYTLMHLDQSYRIRNVPSLYAFLEDNTDVAYNTYKTQLRRCDDKDILTMIDAYHTRIKGKIVKIASNWYTNYKEGRYLNADSDSYSDENYHEMDNNYYAIERLAAKVHLQLIGRRYDRRFLKYSITQSDVSIKRLTNLIEDIIQVDDNGTLKKVISAMIEYYLLTSGKDFDTIGRGEYISYMKTAFASNTSSEQMTLIKDTIDEWITECMVTSGRARYGKTARVGYRKSVYLFLTFLINQNAKIH